MTVFTRHPRARWAVPIGATALIVSGAALGLPGASADTGLPARTAQELLVALETRTPVPLSGTVTTTADLGLPSLPNGSQRRADMADLATGLNTLRVWSDGPRRSRIALLAPSSEADIIRSGSVVWTWNSADNEAHRFDLGSPSDWPDRDSAQSPGDLPSTPEEAAQMVLEALDPTTEVTTSGLGTVAGRPVYELVLTPRGGTLVGSVRIATDAETGVPLRVTIHSTLMATPAFEVGFTSVDLGRPDPSVFEFSPPPGAKVTEHPAPDGSALAAWKDGAAARAEQGVRPTVLGSGWGTVLITDVDIDALTDGTASAPDTGAGAEQALAVIQTLPTTSGSWGSGRVLAGTLFSAILTDDGRLAIGAVTPEALSTALAAQ